MSSENKHLRNSGTATSHSIGFGYLPCPFSLLTTPLCLKTFPLRLLQSKCGCLSATKATECQREQESRLCPIISSPESASPSHLLTDQATKTLTKHLSHPRKYTSARGKKKKKQSMPPRNTQYKGAETSDPIHWSFKQMAPPWRSAKQRP